MWDNNKTLFPSEKEKAESEKPAVSGNIGLIPGPGRKTKSYAGIMNPYEGAC